MCANIYMYIFREIRIMTRRMQMKDDLKEVVNDWKFAAMVIDRWLVLLHLHFTHTVSEMPIYFQSLPDNIHIVYCDYYSCNFAFCSICYAWLE